MKLYVVASIFFILYLYYFSLSWLRYASVTKDIQSYKKKMHANLSEHVGQLKWKRISKKPDILT
jgi:hypothetical protein